MAAIGDAAPTLLDVAKMVDPNGRLAQVVNLMKQRSAIVEDATWMEGNMPTGHRVTSMVGLPSPTWNRVNKGVATGKHKNAQYDEACGLLEAASEVDARLQDIYGGDKFAAYRAQMDAAHQLSMVQELETALFYHSTALTPERINGLTPRYDVTTAESGGSQIIKADAAPSNSDQTSAWYVSWGPEATSCIYPSGSDGGLKSKDMGLVELEDVSGAKYPGFKTYHSWKPGLVVADYRQNVRVCNIDTSALSASGTNIVEALVKGYWQIQNPNVGKLRLYMNRTLATFLHLQARSQGINNPAVVTSIEGKPVMTFLGVPVRITDSILSTEAIVS